LKIPAKLMMCHGLVELAGSQTTTTGNLLQAAVEGSL
jgi:hypothetical protein